MGVDELDSRTYALRNNVNEISAKHNRLNAVVKILYERGGR